MTSKDFVFFAQSVISIYLCNLIRYLGSVTGCLMKCVPRHQTHSLGAIPLK
ncbi:hypothetical protein O97_01430 [Bartonella henselae str. Zeus]|nr:hypothetical protein Q653_01526 [Bartonella henselae JK 42]ETS11098.1 hypothetical protein Q652_01499 [Bartonella henselae JK 41]KEC56223.1 hypothetical protein O97_01430 [Bartonella henselae str. Zeus]KEC58909.1 hypothetical protein O95_01475 [Bartonella henselae JK 53]